MLCTYFSIFPHKLSSNTFRYQIVQQCWNDPCHSLQSHLAGRGVDAWREVKARVVGNLVKPKSAQLRHGKSSQTKKVCNLKKWRGNWRGGKLKRCWWENCGKVLPSGTCRRHLRLNRERWKKFDKVLICCLGLLHDWRWPWRCETCDRFWLWHWRSVRREIDFVKSFSIRHLAKLVVEVKDCEVWRLDAANQAIGTENAIDQLA